MKEFCLILQEEVQNAHLSTVDRRSGLELPSPLDLFLKVPRD
jgi:hypothetical protein